MFQVFCPIQSKPQKRVDKFLGLDNDNDNNRTVISLFQYVFKIVKQEDIRLTYVCFINNIFKILVNTKTSIWNTQYKTHFQTYFKHYCIVILVRLLKVIKIWKCFLYTLYLKYKILYKQIFQTHNTKYIFKSITNSIALKFWLLAEIHIYVWIWKNVVSVFEILFVIDLLVCIWLLCEPRYKQNTPVQQKWKM